ncbi:PKD domain-containing protein [Haladaptatus sp. DYF46]|uniref:PKD domain-containing protein n=1 Tax=Haladaptatus sp. DYF46 TaxID=2886041 RepID=UPI001E5CE303|nr:PKD domain-containing protein [Haladaptatus sp. DYF46]
MNRVVSSTLVLLLLATSVLPSVTTANEPPLADAGLDQHVSRGSTVLLDATGSHDPDGTIERYDWSIETRGGRTITPNCPNCSRTRFRPNAVGTYIVSVTVTDDDGAKRRDTLYVTVSPGAGPEVDVSGPETPRVGEQAIYSATVDAGSAPLDHIVWSLDGTTIATDSLSEANDVDTITRSFPNTGTRTITATVYDSDGQTDTESFDLSIRRSRNQPQPTPDSPSPTPIAEGYLPTITGDKEVTGTRPLRGSYSVQSAPSSSHVRSISWFGDGARLGSGRSLTTDWEPGDHSLYAMVTYSDGSNDIARFSDGSTTVVADPKPSVELPSLDSYGAVSGRATASDSYDNLRSVHVRLGGTEIGHTKMDATSPGRMQHYRTVSFDSQKFEAGKQYTLTVTAVDTRGQTSTLERTLTPAKMPEIIQSGFVKNNVDSYDERIDPKRYTAHHVTKIDLNGVDPEDVEIRFGGKKKGVMKMSKKVEKNQDAIIVDSYWCGENPNEYKILEKISVKNPWHDNTEWSTEIENILHVQPSPPEIRLTVINDGTTGYNPSNWGMVVDASDSFDPDGSDLKFTWKKGAEPIKPDNMTAKFRSVEFAELEVEDEYGLTSRRQYNFLDDYVPNVQDVTVLSEGPYKPNDTVRLRITTNPYQFSKNSYHLYYNLGVSIEGATGTVAEWQKRFISPDEYNASDPRFYTGVVEIPASELFDPSERPKLRVYNQDKPETNKEVEIPEVEVLRTYGTVWQNPRIKSTEYLVKRPTYKWKLATSPSKRDNYLSKGYTIDSKSRDGFEYTLEERKKVKDAKYEDVDRSFSNELQQSAFLQGHPDWWSTGREAEKHTYTTTEHEWRDSKSGRGTFTGRTRRVQTHPPEYRTLKEYAHEYRVEKTGTRTVRKTRQVEVTKTDTKYVMQCSPYGICLEVPEEYTYTTTVTRTYTTTKEYTYTVSRTSTYWSYQKFHFDDWATGNRKRVKVEDAEYKTQYRFEYSERHTRVDYTYGVQTREKVRDAQYEWQQKSTTAKRDVAMSLTQADNWRIGSYRPKITWSLKKSTGTKTATVDHHLEKDTVVMTYVTAKVDVVHQYVTQDGKIQNDTVGDKIIDESYQNFLTQPQIRSRLRRSKKKDENKCTGRDPCIE